ncbi:MAG TPA: Rid family detoxifying hydrolase [Spirochaetota bacterium]|nr:Rid family detoxifying hydrolase [Spirochaetota bacterium]HNT09442.1 Rid family detoxifying hydrolase [Spirochaetota bacterium]HNV45486.1 Rid family detoxifying hydrolase [Spirochaetota bacterium]HPI21623.1 Rid family detoxifying hydrolase [Spirochaetota bacterium]HPU86785.1 Rid family detoxifying hydrolase [Spirochaetota bacterium]
MKIIMTPDAPKPGGHYAHAVIENDIVYVSGQLPLDPTTGKLKGNSIEEQTEQCLANVAAILKAAGSRPDLVLKVTVYLSKTIWLGKVNDIYARFFGAHTPARVVVPIEDLPNAMWIEIDAIAAVAK